MIRLTFWSHVAAFSRGLYRFSDRLAAFAYRKSVQANLSLINRNRKDL